MKKFFKNRKSIQIVNNEKDKKENEKTQVELLSKFYSFSAEYFPTKLDIAQYRMLYSDSYSEQLENLAYKCSSSREIMTYLIPLTLYNLNCNLKFSHLLEQFDPTLLDIKSPSELFHLLFQNSELLLRAMYIHHYSFSNPIPFYYPIVKAYSAKHPIEYTICKELWYSLTPHNAVMSFGLGSAAVTPIGKSTFLDLVFELDFTANSLLTSCFHASTIDLRLTKNFFPGDSCSDYYTEWAFFDFNGPTNTGMVKLMLTHIDIVIIHVLEKDILKNFDDIENGLKAFNLKGKHVYICIRDACLEEGVENYFDGNMYNQIKIPRLQSNPSENGKMFIRKLKHFGREIIMLHEKIPKFNSNNLEGILKKFDITLSEEMIPRQQLVNMAIDAIIKSRTNNELSYDFLSYYSTFVELMKKKYEIAAENDQDKIETLNKHCSQCFIKLNDSKISYIINNIFQKIIMDKDSVLILWKLSQELRVLTNELGTKEALKEQANDKYSIEILWREAILSHKYYNKNNWGKKDDYTETLSKSLSSHVQTGEPFELIDGDNLVFFSKELNSMLRYFYLRQTEFVQHFNSANPENIISEVPIVLSIIGPQSSGKSTLLNYVFGCKFLTSSGRCTRGVYGSILELNKPINKSKFLLVLDTEGIDAAERQNISSSSSIHFDRTLILFCLSVSNIVIINLPGELNNEMQEILKICAFSLNHLKVHTANMPKIIFVLNQIADPNLENRKSALKLLINRLDQEIENDKKTEKIKISSLIKLTSDDLYTLPPAFDIVVVDKPGEEIFKKGVIKQVPSLNFALKCSLLRVSIFEKLNSSINGERPPFTSMSEWLEMAGEIWRTIIKFQDIVKFKNLNELQLHKDLKNIVDDMMEIYFYSEKKEFRKLIYKYSDEIQKFDAKSDCASDLKELIDRKCKEFSDHFEGIKLRCTLEYRSKASNLKESDLIHREHLEQLERLIITEKLDYIISLKSRANEIYNQKQRMESFQRFKNKVTNNIEGYFKMDTQGQDNEYEKLWKDFFELDDMDKLYREQNITDLFLMFSSEWDLIPIKEMLDTYRSVEYKLDEVIQIFKAKLINNLTSNVQDEEQYFYPSKKSLPLKDMQPHFHSNRLEYLSENKFYYMHSTEGQESKFLKYFPNSKAIYKHDWVPEDCMPLLQSCSGYYSDHDINWKELSPNKQIVKLVTSLACQNHQTARYFVNNTTPKFVQDIINEIQKFMDREITPVTIQQIADVLNKRLSIFNHEISYIGAELTIYARRSIGSFVFSMAFKSYYNRMWKLYIKNSETIANEKEILKQYFLNKVEIGKIIHSNMECRSLDKYDVNIAGKYVKAYKVILYNRARYQLSTITNEHLNTMERIFSYESITEEANERVTKALTSTSQSQREFVITFFCERNVALESIFNERWEEYTIRNCEGIISTAVEKQQEFTSLITNQLAKALIILDIQDKSLLNSEKCFQPCEDQPKKCDRFQLNESPVRSMLLYLYYLMNPFYSSDTIRAFFSNEFECNGIKMKLTSDILLQEKLLNCFDLTQDSFFLIKNTQLFSAELIFNLYVFVTNFNKFLLESKIIISKNEFSSSISTERTKMLRNSLGCARRCPCCGVFCDKKRHGTGQCYSSKGHQFASMGGKTWGNDKFRSAIFLCCEHYTDEMVVALPGRLIKWKMFKKTTQNAWDWEIHNNCSQAEKDNRKATLIKVWDKFGKGILDYHRKRGVEITFKPYEENNLKLESSEIIKFQICFVIDGTGSMGKDIIGVRLSIQNLVNNYKKTNKIINFRIVIYRDHCDENVIETYPKGKCFILDDKQIIKFLENVVPEGGGDVPEASLDGIAEGLLSDWDNKDTTRRIIIHSFDAPPHGNFPNYNIHNTNSNPDHCCCCSNLCKFDWEKDVWMKMNKLEVEYHGINTGESYLKEFENTMKKKLDYLCKGFTKCGKEQVNDAVMQIFINYHPPPDEEEDEFCFFSSFSSSLY